MITPISFNDYNKVTQISHRGKLPVQQPVHEITTREIVKNAVTEVKLSVYAPFFSDVAALFGRELIYDEENGRLSGVRRYKNKQLVEVKTFRSGTRKIHELDEYKDGKLVKSSSYKPDGKTLDWTVEYRGKDDVTIFYHPDGKTIKTAQTELNDGTGRMQIKHFDPNFRWLSMENYKNEVLTDMELYYDDRKVSRTYKDDKLARQITNFKTSPVKSFIPIGDQVKNPIHDYITDFDKDEKPILTIIHGTKSSGELFVMGKMEYPDNDTIKLTRYKEDGKELYVEIINKRSGKRTVTYSK